MKMGRRGESRGFIPSARRKMKESDKKQKSRAQKGW
jgi:hypothetical protein